MFNISHRGDFKDTEAFLKRSMKGDYYADLDRYGARGVAALSKATPVDSAKTATSWSYKVTRTAKGAKVTWYNSNVEDGVVIAIILQYGHGTGNGGYVQGRDYINPAMRPIFDSMAQEIWKKVIK